MDILERLYAAAAAADPNTSHDLGDYWNLCAEAAEYIDRMKSAKAYVNDELKECVKSFFEDYLNIREESDSGRMFAPIHVSCCRAMHCVALADLLERMRSLSGASLPRKYEQ